MQGVKTCHLSEAGKAPICFLHLKQPLQPDAPPHVYFPCVSLSLSFFVNWWLALPLDLWLILCNPICSIQAETLWIKGVC